LRTIRFAKSGFVLVALLSLIPSGGSVAQSNPGAAPAGADRPVLNRIAGDTWLTTNAQFDGSHWNSSDPSRASFALWMNDNGYMPNEGKTGAAGFWTHRADCPHTFERITDSCGWNLGLTVTQWKSVIVGGNTIEIDGNNAAPFGRVANTTDGESRFMGLMSNVFGDFSGFDVANRASWIAGVNLTGDTFQIKRLRPTPSSQRVRSADFSNLLEVDHDGNTAVAGSISASRADQVRSSQWATRAALRNGRFEFAFPRAYTAVPVCVATTEGSAGYSLRVAPAKSGCVITSANAKDDSMVDVIVVGNPG
jgi:hypothetical protein